MNPRPAVQSKTSVPCAETAAFVDPLCKQNRRKVKRWARRAAGVLAVLSAHALPAHAQPTVVVRGDPACPSADMIRASLLSARPSGEWPAQTVTVDVERDRLALTLGEPASVRREIPADQDCRIRAYSVAVVIAAWSGELLSHPTDSAVLASDPPAPVLVPPPVMVVRAAPAPKPVASPRYAFDLDAGGFYSLSWGHAPGAWLEVGRTARGGGLGLRVLGAYQSSRDVALEGGTNQVFRLLGGAAASYQDQWRILFALGQVGVLGTLTRADGSGYQPDRSASTTNVGAFADVRGGLSLGRVRVFASARVLGLARSEAVKIQSTSPGIADTATFSRWDLQLGGGLGFLFKQL